MLEEEYKQEWLRKAEQKDINLLLKWANERKVREASFVSAAITPQQHEKWFQNVMKSDCIFQFIYEVDSCPIGQIRIEKKDNETIINYSIAKEYRGKGYGKRMVKLLEREVHDNHPEISELHAYVKKENIASKKVFEDLGFEKSGDMYRKDCK